jgi:hypothetical protein
LELVRADPSLMRRAIEELLRYDGPVERAPNRWPVEDVELGGHTLRRGEDVILILATANHDTKRFPDPRHARHPARRREARGLSAAGAITALVRRSRGSRRRWR